MWLGCKETAITPFTPWELYLDHNGIEGALSPLAHCSCISVMGYNVHTEWWGKASNNIKHEKQAAITSYGANQCRHSIKF